MIFVINNDFTSSILRGNHIAAEMGAKLLFQDIGGARNQNVVIVKETYRGLVLDAKDRGCSIILDIIDYFCYKERQCEFADLVDVLIIPNLACAHWYSKIFKNASFALIPHQWDHRIRGTAQQAGFAPGYIGKGFNCTIPKWDGPKVYQSAQHLEAAPMFNCHIALQRRDEKPVLLKPATKVSTAAAVLANALTYRDPSVVELLGPDYPYYVDGDPMEAIRMARESFGGREWKRGREKMKEVRERTSLKAIAALYRRLDEGDEAMLVNVLREAA